MKSLLYNGQRKKKKKKMIGNYISWYKSESNPCHVQSSHHKDTKPLNYT